MANKRKQEQKKSKARKPANSPAKSGPAFSSRNLYLIAFAFGFLLYANTFTHEYAVDDLLVINSNRFTQQGFAGIGKIMTTDAFEGHFGERGKTLVAGGRYRPLSIVTFAIEYGILGEENPMVSHIINALLYGLLGVLVMAIMLRLFPPEKGSAWYSGIAFLISLLYMAHPIHTEAVANIKGRDEVMGMLFSCAALFSALRFAESSDKKWIVSLVLVYSAALLSKENAITFLAVVPLTLFVFTKAKRDHYIQTLVPMFLCAVVFLLLRNNFTGGNSLESTTTELMNDPFAFSSPSQRYGTVFVTFLHYFRLLFVPHPLSHDYYPYEIPVVGMASPLPLISLLLNGAIFVWAVINIRQKDHLAYGILFYYLTFSVVSNFFFSIGTNMSERFLFMPSLGFAIVLIVGLQRLLQRFAGSSALLMPIALGICLLFAGKTLLRNPDWKNNFTLFSADVVKSDHSLKLNMAYAGELITNAPKAKNEAEGREMYLKALEYLRIAIEDYPDTVINGRPIGYANAYNLVGNAYYNLDKQYDKAMEAFAKAAYYLPGHFDAYQNSVVILMEQNRHREAIPYLHSLRRTRPAEARFIYQLGECYQYAGKFDSAALTYRQLLALDPGYEADVNYKIGLVFARFAKDMDSGLRYLEMAVQLAPDNVSYLEDLGVAYAFDQQVDKAIGIFEKIIQINPRYLNAYQNLSVSYANKGDQAKAAYYQQKADELRATP